MKYKVTVKLTAEVEYETEVEASSWEKAEDAAMSQWREKTPSDFQVDKGYITNWEVDSTQASWECHDCGLAISEVVSQRNDELCDKCLEAFDREVA
jgi:hypothetical protein